MNLSIKQIIKNADNKANAAKAQQKDLNEKAGEGNTEKKEIKHDTPTGCCGSCS